MSFLLDTNVAIDVIRARRVSVRQALAAALGQGFVGLSVVALFELEFGVLRSSHPAVQAQRLSQFRSGVFTGGAVQIVELAEADWMAAADLRATLAAAGTPIGPYDVLIGAQALRRKLTLVTADLAEFGRIPGLALTSWR